MSAADFCQLPYTAGADLEDARAVKISGTTFVYATSATDQIAGITVGATKSGYFPTVMTKGKCRISLASGASVTDPVGLVVTTAGEFTPTGNDTAGNLVFVRSETPSTATAGYCDGYIDVNAGAVPLA